MPPAAGLELGEEGVAVLSGAVIDFPPVEPPVMDEPPVMEEPPVMDEPPVMVEPPVEAGVIPPAVGATVLPGFEVEDASPP